MHTITVPGGTATFYDRGEVTPRRLRPMQEAALQIGSLMSTLATATSIGDADNRPELPGPAVPDMTEHQAHVVAGVQDLATFAYLHSWDLDPPREYPSSADGLQDLPMDLYNALAAEGAKLSTAESGFLVGPGTVGDLKSPTGASAG